jgi:hypothetical protein
MFLTSVSVIIPVIDGQAVKAYTRNGSNTPRSMNLRLKSTWITIVVKYISRLLRLKFQFFTRHLYSSQQNFGWPRIKQHAYRNTFKCSVSLGNFLLLSCDKEVEKFWNSLWPFLPHFELILHLSPSQNLSVFMYIAYILRRNTGGSERSSWRSDRSIPGASPTFLFSCEVILK